MNGADAARTLVATPAATLVLFRPQIDGPDEHLFVQRGAAMAFAAGAIVFPGGRVDATDHAFAAALGGSEDPDELAAKIAAIRETIEETGVATAIDPAPPAALVATWRGALAEGTPLTSLLGTHRIVPERLVPFARWRPGAREGRIFDARFFIAEAPAASAPLADGGESVHAFWSDAATVLAETAAGRHRMIFPTLLNVERLAALGTYAAALAQVAEHPTRLISPYCEQRGDEDWLCIPENVGYPVTARPLASVQRG